MTFLNVPYAEKDEARALGARWNPGKKRWYVPSGVALDAFAKWMPKEGEAPAGGRFALRAHHILAFLGPCREFFRIP